MHARTYLQYLLQQPVRQLQQQGLGVASTCTIITYIRCLRDRPTDVDDLREAPLKAFNCMLSMVPIISDQNWASFPSTNLNSKVKITKLCLLLCTRKASDT